MANQLVASPSWRYHVFLSYRGDDIRTNFTNHLYYALKDREIKIFNDQVTPTNFANSCKPIEESRISIVIFSTNYAYSWWCLEELVKILQCRESKQQIVLPIFYKVDPSHSFGFGDGVLERNFGVNNETVLMWKRALTEGAHLPGGYVVKEGDSEARIISDIVQDILVRLNDDCLSSNSSPSNDNNDDQNADDNVGSVGIVRVNQEPIHSIFSPDGKFRRSVMWRKLREPLGIGFYGTVYEGLTDDGIFFAVKEVSLLDQGSQGKQSVIQLEQEISLLSQFEHDNIVQYLGTHKDETKIYIFLELVTKGSLAKLYQNYNLEDSQVSGFTRQILSGLTYLHERGVVHRDIKCANILVHASGSVKLADFGLAKVTKLNELKSSKGTAYWMAPEVVNQMNGGYGLAADIWSLGCTVLEMLTRQPPYFPLEWMQALFQIALGKLPPVPNSLSGDAKDFILKCLQVDPNSRPTAAQLLNHPFVERPLHASSVPASHCNSLRS